MVCWLVGCVCMLWRWPPLGYKWIFVVNDCGVRGDDDDGDDGGGDGDGNNEWTCFKLFCHSFHKLLGKEECLCDNFPQGATLANANEMLCF